MQIKTNFCKQQTLPFSSHIKHASERFWRFMRSAKLNLGLSFLSEGV